LERQLDQVKATLAAAQERANRDAGDLLMPQLFTESLPDDELAAANRPPEETRTGDAG